MEPKTYPEGVPSWVDTEQRDLEAAMRFYGGLFGWTFAEATPPGAPQRYVVAQLGGQDVAGLSGPADPGAPGLPGQLLETEGRGAPRPRGAPRARGTEPEPRLEHLRGSRRRRRRGRAHRGFRRPGAAAALRRGRGRAVGVVC